MIYFDNAATTFPKPPEVEEAVLRCVRAEGGNAGRGAHRLALAAAERVFAVRESVAAFVNAPDPAHVVFTQNTTLALNMAIEGLLPRGGHVLISELEHNAVRRPVLRAAREGRLTYDIFPVLGLSAEALLAGIAARCKPETAAIVCTHGSNVCSVTLPLAAIGAFCRKRGLLFLVDAAQTAGHLPLDLRAMQIDALALPAHKGLYGIQGCGVLALGEGVLPRPFAVGGSGVDSRTAEMPAELPERLEAGTLPTPAVAALGAGLSFVRSHGVAAIHAHEKTLWHAARERLAALPDVVIHDETPGAVLLFSRRGVPSVEVARTLDRAGVCVRAGLHCAPFAHRALGTPADGAVRIGFGVFNTVPEVDALWRALQ